MGENTKELGQSIQQARNIAGLTQQELCQKTGLSYSTLAKIERGAIKTPSVFTVFKIATVLDISIDELLGAVVDSDYGVHKSKMTSKNGVSFVYFDVNGCLVRFFHTAFGQLAADTGLTSDVVESAFWHYNDAVCRGEITMSEFNKKFSNKLGVDTFDWTQYYMSAIERIDDMYALVEWAASRYRVGLLTNIMPGFIEAMVKAQVLPDVAYDSVVDSTQVKAIKPETEIYRLAEVRSGVDPSSILFVDDSRTNLMAAERRGWKVLWFDVSRPEESSRKIRKTLD